MAGGICGLAGGNARGNAQHDCNCPVDPKIQCCGFDTLGLPRCCGLGACGGTDGLTCALYGQGCNAGVPCCNGVQCTYSPTGAACGETQAGCTCFNPAIVP